MKQGTDAWMRLRCGKATASRVADLCARAKTGWGAGRKNMIATLVAERLSGQCAETFQSAAMAWGTEHEDDARAAYEFLHGVQVEQVGFTDHPTIEWSGASPDGLVSDDGLVEIKCPNTATHIDTLLGAPIDGKYIKQMMWQMECTGRKWCDFVSYDPRLPVSMQTHVQRVERDDELIASIRADVQSALEEIESKISDLLGRYENQEAS